MCKHISRNRNCPHHAADARLYYSRFWDWELGLRIETTKNWSVGRCLQHVGTSTRQPPDTTLKDFLYKIYKMALYEKLQKLQNFRGGPNKPQLSEYNVFFAVRFRGYAPSVQTIVNVMVFLILCWGCFENHWKRKGSDRLRERAAWLNPR